MKRLFGTMAPVARQVRSWRLVLAMAVVALTASSLLAGRLGGPTSARGTVPAGLSVYYDFTFVAGEPAIVTVSGDGLSMLDLIMYDSDGHVAQGVGTWDRKVVQMNVYRAGVFRIEVRNLGNLPDTFLLTTN